ncbi:MAG: glycoside hydrolase family 5 protein [Gaiellales bacterium]
MGAAAGLVVAAGVVVWAVHGRGGSDQPKPLPPTPRLTLPQRATGLAKPWVTTQGTQFVDQQGNPIVLRGYDVAVGSESAYQTAPQLGANFVRIYIAWSQVEPRRPHGTRHRWDEQLLSRLDREVQFYESAHVNVLIDFHQFHWSPWYAQAECKPGARACNGSGVPAWYYRGRYGQDKGSESKAKAAFWTTERRQSLYYYSAFAEMMAARYGHYPNVLGYEIFNEPHEGALPETTATTNLMLSWQGEIARVMHAVDPTRTVVFMCRGGGEGIGTANLSLIPGPHVALDFHDYFNGHPGYGFDTAGDNWAPSWPATHNQTTPGGYTGTQDAQASVLQLPVSRAQHYDIPLLVGEWGIHTGTAGANAYQQQMVDAMGADNLSWARWNLATSGGFGLLDGRSTPSAEATQLAQLISQ